MPRATAISVASALSAGVVAYAGVTILIQTLVIVFLALALGADYKGGVGGVLVMLLGASLPTASACSRASARR